MKKYVLPLLATALLSSQVSANAIVTGGEPEYLCSYRAQISDNDKFNSSGNLIATQYNKAAVAGVIRQDRANFHKFGIIDQYDTSDCVFHLPQNRALLEQWLTKGKISPQNIRRIVDGNPIINVDVYRNSISVNIQ